MITKEGEQNALGVGGDANRVNQARVIKTAPPLSKVDQLLKDQESMYPSSSEDDESEEGKENKEDERMEVDKQKEPEPAQNFTLGATQLLHHSTMLGVTQPQHSTLSATQLVLAGASPRGKAVVASAPTSTQSGHDTLSQIMKEIVVLGAQQQQTRVNATKAISPITRLASSTIDDTSVVMRNSQGGQIGGGGDELARLIRNSTYNGKRKRLETTWYCWQTIQMILNSGIKFLTCVEVFY